MHKAIIIDTPYPSVDILTEDRQAANILAPAYASATNSELLATTQYIFQHFHFYKEGLEEIADTFENIAIAEMMHFDMLGKALLNMGVNPVLSACPPQRCNFFNTSCLSYSVTPQKMILDAITGEYEAISQYRRMIAQLKNEQAAAILERIVMDEELHIKVLNSMLQRIVNVPASN